MNEVIYRIYYVIWGVPLDRVCRSAVNYVNLLYGVVVGLSQVPEKVIWRGRNTPFQ
jgi:hypothetical protein